MYPGSITTPPCQEGVRWHVLHEPLRVPARAIEHLETLLARTFNVARPSQALQFRTNNRFLQPRNGRPLWRCAECVCRDLPY
jgi:carbonic anhydrase